MASIKIERYIRNEMSGRQKATFENELFEDKYLQKEYMFQRDLISQIEALRKKELKARLERLTPQATIKTTNKLYKGIAASMLAGVMLAATSYYFIKSSDETQDEVEPKTIFQKNTNAISPEKTIEISNEKTKQPQDIVSEKPHETISTKQQEDAPISNNNISILITHEKTKFHYKFSNNKLSLYGNFGNSPYEILPFTQNNSFKYYLYHNSEFYFIKDSTVKLTELTKVTKSHLIEKLEQQRQQNN